MPKPIPTQCWLFSELTGKPIVARFDQEHSSSDGGAVLLQGAEHRLGLADRLAGCLLKHARLDHTYEQELRRLIALDLLILDDFSLDRMDPVESRDVYEILTERSPSGSIIVTSMLPRFCGHTI